MSARQMQTRSLPLQGGGSGWGSLHAANNPHPTAFATLQRSTSPFQGEVEKSAEARA